MQRNVRDIVVLSARGKIRWLLRDEFSDTRAAGAVNGTPATPGPGTRVATDTDGDALSISGGLMRFANPNDAYGDPGLWYASQVRVAGRLLLASVDVAATNKIAMYGWAGAQAGAPTAGALQFNTDGNVRAREAVGFMSGLAIYAATTYKLAVVVRAPGTYYFIKGGAFSTWTLLRIDDATATSPLYLTLSNHGTVNTHDWARIPDALWLPTPLTYDTFTRADGALGSSETVGPDGQGVAARTWVNRVGTTLVATNKAQASVLDGGVAIATVDTGTVNAITTATLTRAGNEVGVVLRYVDADNYIRAIHDGTNCKLIKRVATAETDVISAAVAIGAGAIRVIPEGTSFSLYLNDTQVGATSTISDAALQTGTEQGLYSTNLGNTQDLLSIFPRGSNGEYAALNRWSF